jgi:hypothetical protein
MPSSSKKRHDAMAAAAHDPKTAKGMGISQKQAQEFVAADKKAGKFQGSKGGKK